MISAKNHKFVAHVRLWRGGRNRIIRGQRSTLETLRQAAVLEPQGRFLARLFLLARVRLCRGGRNRKIRGQRSTLETLRQAALLEPQGRFLARFFFAVRTVSKL